MFTPFVKAKRTFDYHFYRIKNNWTFPSNTAHATGARIAKGLHESGTSSVVNKHLDEGAIFLDVGANVGYYSRLASHLVKRSGRVFAFEVEHDNYYALTQNTASFDNVIPLNLAVSNENSFLKVNHSSHSACHSIVDNDNHLDGDQFITPTITLDIFWSLYLDKSKIDLIKIDVEGAEPNVLEGMQTVLSEDKIETMIIEYCPQLLVNTGRDPLMFYKMLARYFSISVIEKKYRKHQTGSRIETIDEFERITNYLLNMEGAVNSNLLCRIPC